MDPAGLIRSLRRDGIGDPVQGATATVPRDVFIGEADQNAAWLMEQPAGGSFVPLVSR